MNDDYRIVGDVLLRPLGAPPGVRVQCWAVTSHHQQCQNWAKWLTATFVPVCHQHTALKQPYVCMTCDGTGICVDGPEHQPRRPLL